MYNFVPSLEMNVPVIAFSDQSTSLYKSGDIVSCSETKICCNSLPDIDWLTWLAEVTHVIAEEDWQKYPGLSTKVHHLIYQGM